VRNNFEKLRKILNQ